MSRFAPALLISAAFWAGLLITLPFGVVLGLLALAAFGVFLVAAGTTELEVIERRVPPEPITPRADNLIPMRKRA